MRTQHPPERPLRQSARRHCACRKVLPIVAFVLLLIPVVGADSPVAPIGGTATVSSFQVAPGAPDLETDAYLVGFRTDGGDESDFQWSFQAEGLEVLLEHQHFTGGDLTPIFAGSTYENSTHADVSGALQEGYPLTYFMAVSAGPDDPQARYGLRFRADIDALDSRESIGFGTNRLEEEDDTPVERDMLRPSQDREFRRPWTNLQIDLENHRGALTLKGDFTVHLFDMVFQVTEEDGKETTYEALYGGARGDELPSLLRDYNNTRAELRFTNATFTLLPAGRPMQVNLRSADVEASGGVYLSGARGTLRSDGLDVRLSGSLVEMDAEDLRLTLTAERETPPLYGVDFSGLVRSAAVDGRPLDLAASTDLPPDEDASSEPASVVSMPAGGGLGWLAWSLLLIPATVVATGGGWLFVRRNRVSVDSVLDQAKMAMDDGHSVRAGRLLQRILQRDPLNTVATLMKARLSLRNGRPDEAIEFLEPLVDGPVDQHGAVSMAYCTALRDAGRIGEARAVFEKIKAKHPEVGSLEETLMPPSEEKRQADDMTYI